MSGDGNTVPDTVEFRCNICGAHNRDVPLQMIDREVPSCSECGSTVRMRSIAHLLGIALHGRPAPLVEWPTNRRIRGMGLSDWQPFAQRLAQKVSYINTFFHTEPHLDICNPPNDWAGTLDFLVSSEVFEHVPPPVDRAFAASALLLKRGGWLVLTVPFSNEPETREHFPDLRHYRIIEIEDERILVNRRGPGDVEARTDLVFHGGPGETLEMRLFSRAALLRHLQAAGFATVSVMEEDYPPAGILHRHPWSLPILAQKSA